MSSSPQLVVVDDDRDMRDLLLAFFKPKGYQVTCFADAESALQESRSSGEYWDVVLSDLNLPQMSGVDFTLLLKKNLPQVPVIFITTSKSAEVAVDAVKNGAYDFLVKPVHFPQLLNSVERALHVKSLHEDITELRERVRSTGSLRHKIIGKSPRFLEALDLARRVARSKANILITGESGTGKEVFARFIHSESPRARGPFVAINCSAIPEQLLESELFGHARGAFTGAQDRKVGLFEEAESGTLFLDEIGDLGLPLQAKLLRVFQEKKIKRVGENLLRPIDCRFISATHKDLLKEIREQRFREDLFFRLNVIPIHIPPLRERPEDIVPLAETFLRRFAIDNNSPAKFFAKDVLRYVLKNVWRGNVRELENAVERATVLSTDAEVPLHNMLPLNPLPSETSPVPEHAAHDVFTVSCENGLPLFEEVMNQFVEYAVERNGGARDRTAKEIGIDRKTLYKRLRQAPALVH